jgi:hypothetical protein
MSVTGNVQQKQKIKPTKSIIGNARQKQKIKPTKAVGEKEEKHTMSCQTSLEMLLPKEWIY